MERLNYHHLYLFWVLSQEGTFTKAAERLRIAQSAVTSQIQQLEEQLGLVLVDRQNRRRPVLTEEGLKVVSYAQAIFEAGDELLKWSKIGERDNQKTLRVGAISGLSRNFLYEFFEPLLDHEQTKIEVTTGDQEKLIRLLKEHSLDLILSSHNVQSEGRIGFRSHVLKSSPLVFVVASAHKIKRADLKDYLKVRPLYVPGDAFEAKPELNAFLERLKIPLKIRGEFDDIALLRVFAVKSGAVVAIPQMGVLNDLLSNDLSIISKAASIEQRFYAITRQKRFPNSIISHLIESMAQKDHRDLAR